MIAREKVNENSLDSARESEWACAILSLSSLASHTKVKNITDTYQLNGEAGIMRPGGAQQLAAELDLIDLVHVLLLLRDRQRRQLQWVVLSDMRAHV